MAQCNVPTLLARTSGFANMLTPGMRPMARVALLSSILQSVQPSFVPNLATINSLLASARCFTCLSPGERRVIRAQLLCEILNAPGVPGTAPGVFTANATAISASAINLSWTQPSGSGVTFSGYRGTSPGVTTSNGTLIFSNQAGLTFGDTGLSASTPYYYLVVANNTSGSSNATCNATTLTPSFSITNLTPTDFTNPAFVGTPSLSSVVFNFATAVLLQPVPSNIPVCAIGYGQTLGSPKTVTITAILVNGVSDPPLVSQFIIFNNTTSGFSFEWPAGLTSASGQTFQVSISLS